jgi:hypothetical protein
MDTDSTSQQASTGAGRLKEQYYEAEENIYAQAINTVISEGTRH